MDIEKVSHEQPKGLEAKFDKQFQYLHNQCTSTINWRLEQYHAELLKEVKHMLTPLASTIQHLEEEVAHCMNSTHTRTEEVSSIHHSYTSVPPPVLIHASVQTFLDESPSWKPPVQPPHP